MNEEGASPHRVLHELCLGSDSDHESDNEEPRNFAEARIKAKLTPDTGYPTPLLYSTMWIL
jgi:hypothetical protein